MGMVIIVFASNFSTELDKWMYGNVVNNQHEEERGFTRLIRIPVKIYNLIFAFYYNCPSL